MVELVVAAKEGRRRGAGQLSGRRRLGQHDCGCAYAGRRVHWRARQSSIVQVKAVWPREACAGRPRPIKRNAHGGGKRFIDHIIVKIGGQLGGGRLLRRRAQVAGLRAEHREPQVRRLTAPLFRARTSPARARARAASLHITIGIHLLPHRPSRPGSRTSRPAPPGESSPRQRTVLAPWSRRGAAAPLGKPHQKKTPGRRRP